MSIYAVNHDLSNSQPVLTFHYRDEPQVYTAELSANASKILLEDAWENAYGETHIDLQSESVQKNGKEIATEEYVATAIAQMKSEILAELKEHINELITNGEW